MLPTSEVDLIRIIAESIVFDPITDVLKVAPNLRLSGHKLLVVPESMPAAFTVAVFVMCVPARVVKL